MKRFEGIRLIAADELASHNYICDLIYVQFSVLSLYTDGRNNWIYLWSDTDSNGRDRWLLFQITRQSLADYLKGQMTMREVVQKAERLLLLETRAGDLEGRRFSQDARMPKRYLREVTQEQIDEYLPTAQSYFDPTLTEDLDLTEEVVPKVYNVPIIGDWFSTDFEYLFKRYQRLYSFFYATRPRFVRTVASKLGELLRAPWRGGYSRLNLFSQLAIEIPAIHTLKIDALKYASPGHVRFEAIPAIGNSIRTATLRYLECEEAITAATKNINKTLKRARLRKENTSELSDTALNLEKKTLDELRKWCRDIAKSLGIVDEAQSLRQHSPNTVVYSKALLSFVRQLSRLAGLQRRKMLNF